MKKANLISLSSWLGACLFVLAYVLLSFDVLSSHSVVYHSINLIGAFFYIPDIFIKKAFSAVFIEIIWGSVATISIIRIIYYAN